MRSGAGWARSGSRERQNPQIRHLPPQCDLAPDSQQPISTIAEKLTEDVAERKLSIVPAEELE